MPATFNEYSKFNKDANFESVRFGMGAKVLEVELNELQNIQNEARAEVVRDSIHSGFVKLSAIDHAYNSTNPNRIRLSEESIAYVNGYKIAIPAQTIIEAGAPPEANPREDLVFLEVWKEEVNHTQTVDKGGQAGAGGVTNELRDGRVGVETARRVQLKWRLRAVAGVDFSVFPEGITRDTSGVNMVSMQDTKVLPQGGNGSPIAHTFSSQSYLTLFINARQRRAGLAFNYLSNYTLNDEGLYVAGNGNQASMTALKTVDGYVYAIPMFRVYRRPSSGFMASEEYNIVAPLADGKHVAEVTSKSRVAHSGAEGNINVSLQGNSYSQFVINGNFANGTTGWAGSNASLTSNNKTLSITGTGAGNQPRATQTTANPISPNKKIYIRARVRVTNADALNLNITVTGSSGGTTFIQSITNPVANQWYLLSFVYTAPSDVSGNVRFLIGSLYSDATTANGKVMEVQEVMAIDLDQHPTLSTLTADQINQRILHWIRGGVAVHTESVRVKSVGKNFIDKSKLEIGTISGANGEKAVDTTRFRTNFIKVQSGVSLVSSQVTGYTRAGTYWYDENKKFIEVSSPLLTNPPPTHKYCIIVFAGNPTSRNIVLEDFELSKVQLERGTVATSYEPFSDGGSMYVPSIGKRVGVAFDEIRDGKKYQRVGSLVLTQQNLDTFELVTSLSETNYLRKNNIVSDSVAFTAGVNNFVSLEGIEQINETANATSLNKVENIGKFATNSGNQLIYVISKSTTLEQAKQQLLGRSLNYQMATEVKKEADIRGRLYVAPGVNNFIVDQVTIAKTLPKAVTAAVMETTFVDVNADGVPDGWTLGSDTDMTLKEVASGAFHVQVGSSPVGTPVLSKNEVLNTTDKFYQFADVDLKAASVSLRNPTAIFDVLGRQRISRVVTSSTNNLQFSFGASADCWVYKAGAINLTTLFGAGNEPSKEWCDKYLEFGTNYAVEAPVGCTAEGATRDNKDNFPGAHRHVVVIPASKYRDGLYEVFYQEPSENHVPPDVTITIGAKTLSLTNGATVGSLDLVDTDVPLRKHADGARRFYRLANLAVSTLLNDEIRQVTISSDTYALAEVGDRLKPPSIAFECLQIISKDGSNKITIQNISGSTRGVDHYDFVRSARPDNLLADIVADRDIVDLRHQVSLTGFNYQALLEENFDKLLRGELQTKERVRQKKTYFGLPKTPSDDNTVFYASFDGTGIAEINNDQVTMVNRPTQFRSAVTGIGGVAGGEITSNALRLIIPRELIPAENFTVEFFIVPLTTARLNQHMFTMGTGNMFNQGFCHASNIPLVPFVPNHIRVNSDRKLYLNGKLVRQLTFSGELIAGNWHITFGGNQNVDNTNIGQYIISDVHISNIDRGTHFPTLPKDFIEGRAIVAPAFNRQRRTYSDALTGQYTMETVRAFAPTDRSQHHIITQATEGVWASGDKVKIKGLSSDSIISGVIDTDTALATIVSNGTNTSIVWLDDVSKIAVNDTVVVLTSTGGLIYGTRTVTNVDTTNKTITLDGSAMNLVAGQFIVETTASSSSPVVRFMNGTTQTTVTGTWAGLGTNEAEFTLGTNAGLTNQDLQVEYSKNLRPGQGQIDVYSKTLAGEVNGKRLAAGTTVKIVDDFRGKIKESTVECANISKAAAHASLLAPSSGTFGEINTADYDRISALDGTPRTATAVTNTHLAQQLFSFNLIEIVERKLGMIIPSVNKVQWLRDNLKSASVVHHGYGTSPSGNKVLLQIWLHGTSLWTAIDSTNGHTSAIVTRISYGMSDFNGFMDSTGFIHAIAYTNASDGTIASTIHTDYVNIEVELKVPAGYDVLAPENQRVDDSWKVTSEDIKVVNDFAGKVSGSTVVNPHVAKYQYGAALIAPTGSWNEHTQVNADKLKTLNNVAVTNTTPTNTEMAQQLFSFNLVEQIERKYGKIPAKDKVAWIRSFVEKLTCSWYGFGSCPAGNKASFARWRPTVNEWQYPPIPSHTSNTPTVLSSSMLASIDTWIDANGFVHFLAHTDASDGVTASTINTDYVNLEVILKPEATKLLQWFKDNRKIQKSNVLLVRKETKEVQTMFPATNEDRIAVWGDVVNYQGRLGLSDITALKGSVLASKMIVSTIGTGGKPGVPQERYYQMSVQLPLQKNEKDFSLDSRGVIKNSNIPIPYMEVPFVPYTYSASTRISNPKMVENAVNWIIPHTRGTRPDRYFSALDSEYGMYGVTALVKPDTLNGMFSAVYAVLVLDANSREIHMVVVRKNTVNDFYVIFDGNDTVQASADHYKIDFRPLVKGV